MKPKVFPRKKGKCVWFWQHLLEELRRLHIGSSLHSLGLSSHQLQSSLRKGGVNQHAAMRPGTSQAAREGGGLPILLQDTVLPWDFTGFSLSIWIIARPSLLPPDFWWDVVFLKWPHSQGQLLTVDTHSWCHVCPEILTDNLLMVAPLMISVERILLAEKRMASIADDFKKNIMGKEYKIGKGERIGLFSSWRHLEVNSEN